MFLQALISVLRKRFSPCVPSPCLHPMCVTSSDVFQLHNTGCQWVIDMTCTGPFSLVAETHLFHCNVFLEGTFKKSYSCESSKESGQYIQPCKFGTGQTNKSIPVCSQPANVKERQLISHSITSLAWQFAPKLTRN